ncbi:MAG: alpha/beta fold hydrolase [Candidatus Hodarchaeota archaeon]
MDVKKTQLGLLVIFFILITFGSVFLNVFPFSIRKDLHKVKSSDGVDVFYNVYYNLDQEVKPPLIVVGHGIFVNKEFMSAFAYECAHQGFVVANLDWRGHGLSSGQLSDDLMILEDDLEAVITDVGTLGIADLSNIGLLAYSIGGYPMFSYATKHPEVKAWVGMATTPNGKLGNTTNPCNVLLINGENDEIFNERKCLDEFINLTNITSIHDLEENHIYGDFSTGTARKFQTPRNANHFSVPWDRRFVKESTKWFCRAFNGFEPDLSVMVFDLRLIALIIGMIGLFGLVFAFSIILSRNFSKYREVENLAMLEAIFARNKFRRTLNLAVLREIYPWTALLVSTIIIPVITYSFSIPITTSLLLVIIALILNLIYYARSVIKKRKKKVNLLMKMKIFRDPRIWLFSLVISIIFLAGYYSMIGLHFIGMIPSSKKAPFLFMFIPLLFTIFGLFNIFTRRFIRPRLREKLKEKKPVGSFLLEGLAEFVLVLGWNLAIMFLIAYFSGYFFLIMITFLLIPIFLFTSFFGLFMEYITRTIVPGALLHSFLVGFMFVTLTPLFGIFGFPA